MLEKILKIVKTIDSCKFIHQLDPIIEMINTFERDDKPKDERISQDLIKYCRAKESKLIRISELKPELLENKFKPLVKHTRTETIDSDLIIDQNGRRKKPII